MHLIGDVILLDNVSRLSHVLIGYRRQLEAGALIPKSVGISVYMQVGSNVLRKEIHGVQVCQKWPNELVRYVNFQTACRSQHVQHLDNERQFATMIGMGVGNKDPVQLHRIETESKKRRGHPTPAIYQA